MNAVENTACDDVAIYPGLFPEWGLSVTQLSSGKFGFRETRSRLPGADLSWYAVGQANEAVEHYLKPGLIVSFILECDRFYRYNGIELSANTAFVQLNEQECAFSIGGQASVLELQISNDLVADLKWKLPARLVHAVGKKRMQEFLLYTAACSEVCKHGGPAALATYQAGLVDRVGKMLRLKPEAADASRLASGGSSSGYQTVKRANEWFSQLSVKRPVEIRDLVHALDLPERSLYRAFETWVGVGPSRYFEIQRLHGVRRELVQDTGRARKISEFAEMFGFSNPGRMSKRYCELFHEYPRHTASRASQHRRQSG